MELLRKQLETLDQNNRKIVIAREITKIYEEIVSGDISEVMNHFIANPIKVKGEFVFVIQGNKV